MNVVCACILVLVFVYMCMLGRVPAWVLGCLRACMWFVCGAVCVCVTFCAMETELARIAGMSCGAVLE